MKKIIFMSVFFLLSACGNKIEGTYVSGSGVSAASLTFKSDGKVLVHGSLGDHEYPYEISGDKIRVMYAVGPVPVVINNDGSITALGQIYIKK